MQLSSQITFFLLPLLMFLASVCLTLISSLVCLSFCLIEVFVASLLAEKVRNLPAIQETQVQSLGKEYPLEEEMATHASILAWRIPWREVPGRLQSMGSQRVRQDWETNTFIFQEMTNFTPCSLPRSSKGEEALLLPLNHIIYNKIP